MKINNSGKTSEASIFSLSVFAFEAFVVIASFFYVQLMADSVAMYTGYEIATFVVPGFVAVFASLFVGKVLSFTGKKLWVLMLATAVMSIAPISLFMLLVNFVDGPF